MIATSAALLVVESAATIRSALDEDGWILDGSSDVVIVPTAAAFTGVTAATAELSGHFDFSGARLEGLMVENRTSANEPYFARRIREADLVVLGDGAALHARSVWRTSAVADALGEARAILAVGAVASVLGEVMIDPRGGAPTTGLGLYGDLVISAGPDDEQNERTRELLGPTVTLATLLPGGGLVRNHGPWRTVVNGAVVTRGRAEVTL
jgi:hypothetical protein